MDLEKWAARHDALIGPDAAEAAGLTNRTARHRATTGRYLRLRRGVYAINGAPPSWLQAVRAVILAHPDLAASHDTAQRLLGGVPLELVDLIHVTGSSADRCRLEGVVGHRSRTLEPGDLTSRLGIPCTSPIRTVLDRSGSLDAKALGDVVDDFQRRRLLRLWELRARVNRTKPAPGRSVKTLQAVLKIRIPGYDPGESELEKKILLVLSAHGLPLPSQQVKVKLGPDKYRLDFAWPDKRIFLEGQSFGWHHLTSDLESDARRQNRLVLDGWRPLQITWNMPDDEVAATVSAALRL